MDPKLGSEFDKEEARRLIRVALLCTNASPVLRPTMSEVVSMLEGQTAVLEVVSDPGIYGDDWGSDVRFKPLKAYHQQAQNKNSATEKQDGNSSQMTRNEPSVSTASAHDLYQKIPESLIESGYDLYQISPESMNLSDMSSLISHHSASTLH